MDTGANAGAADRPPGWPGLTGIGDDDDEQPPLRQCSALFHPPGDASLAVSGVAQDEWGAWHHHLSNDSIESAVLAVSVDDETDAALRRLHDLLDREHLLFWNVARFFGLVDDASSYATKSALPSPMLLASLLLLLILDADVRWRRKR